MEQLWFLDLDGIKSGPYPTSDIQQLIMAEKVLARHQISPHLTQGPWQTILEWHQQISDTILSEPQFLVEAKPELIEEDEPLPHEISTAEVIKEEQSTTVKRDPVAEMFDLLQRTKQKREEKSYQVAVAAAESNKPFESRSKTNLNLVFGVLVISITGFVIGQWLQKKPSNPTAETKKANPEEKSAKPLEPQIQTREIQVTGASPTDKIIIRAKVSQPERTPIPPAPPPQPQRVVNDPEIEELRSLKKELQELKSLKDELKNTIAEDNDPNDYPINSNPEGYSDQYFPNAYDGNGGSGNALPAPSGQPASSDLPREPLDPSIR